MTQAATSIIAISIVNWNTSDATLRCLHSLQALRTTNARIVVVDNASVDDSVARIRQAYPDIALIQSEENLGFAGGHALGLAQARSWGATAIWLLNNDAEVEAQTLDQLLAAWQQHGDAIYGSAPLRRDHDGAVYLNFPEKYLDQGSAPKAWQRDREILFDADWQQHDPIHVGAVVGSSMLLPIAVIDAHGWLGSDWFMYCEEIDYCYRLRQRGVASYLVPRSPIWHQGGGSHRADAGVEDCIHYYRARNEIILANRHSGYGVGAVTAAKKTLRGVYAALINPRRGGMIWRGVCDAVVGRLGKTLAPEDFIEGSARTSSLRKRLQKLRRGIQKPALTITRGQRGAIAYNPQHLIYIRAYYLYCVALFQNELAKSDIAVNLVFGNYAADFDNDYPRKKVDIQYEHTLVEPGGRDSAGAPIGAVPLLSGSGRYLVRIEHHAHLCACDLIIDYSQANLANIKTSGQFNDYLAKTICIAPLLYAPDFAPRRRSGGIITLFSDIFQARRARFLQSARASGLTIRNIKSVFDQRALQAIYKNTKILINLHQTDHHHTLEELRVLPALLCGVIVISEDVPLKDHIPYSQYIIWSSYEKLIDTAARIAGNYEHHYREIFADPELEKILTVMRQNNADALQATIERWRGR